MSLLLWIAAAYFCGIAIVLMLMTGHWLVQRRQPGHRNIASD